MTLKTSAFIATSVDGFIAREDGELDWLDAASATVPEGEDCGYQAFMASVDVLVMGRRTFDKVLTLGPWPYGETPVIVLSRRPLPPAAELPATVRHSSEDPASLCDRLEREGVAHVYVDGGVTIQRFLAAGRLDELIVTRIPVLLGSGTPLFGAVPHDVALKCVDVTTWDFGFVQVRYAIPRTQ